MLFLCLVSLLFVFCYQCIQTLALMLVQVNVRSLKLIVERLEQLRLIYSLLTQGTTEEGEIGILNASGNALKAPYSDVTSQRKNLKIALCFGP